MDLDNSQDLAPPAAPLSPDSLSLPIAALGDLPARDRLHGSQDAAARVMESLAVQLAAASPCGRA
jgi:hypothetical protein